MKFDPKEIEALEAMLPAMGRTIAEKGIGAKAFNDLSRDEALGLFAATVREFRTSFHGVLDGDVPF